MAMEFNQNGEGGGAVEMPVTRHHMVIDVEGGNEIWTKVACISCLYHSRYRSGTLMCHWLGSFSEMLFFLFQTLDLLAAMCEQKQYKFSRLDGSTPSMQRMQIVKRFNSLHSDHCKFSNFL